jgi:hypothetical protein
MFKKEMNMHPMADAYKRNFNLIDRFDRSLSDILLQVQFGSQHQRYHQSLLFVGVVNAWVLLLESKCTRSNPIDKVRRKFPLKKELEQLGLRLVRRSPPSQPATRHSRLSVQKINKIRQPLAFLYHCKAGVTENGMVCTDVQPENEKEIILLPVRWLGSVEV